MISWSDNLYLDENIKDSDFEKIKNDINNHVFTRNIYCITFASNPQNLFEIYHAKEFIQSYYRRKDIHILGIAKSKKNAFMLVAKMLEEVYKKTGEFKVRDYFS